MIFGTVLVAALAFMPEDAAFAHRSACEFVTNCTPRDAGTIRGAIAANWILDHASMTGADTRRDPFRAMTPDGERSFVNLYSEFASNPTGRWTVVVSHYDTKPGRKCPGANDGASTTGLLIALANLLANAKEPVGNVMLVWTDAEECRGEQYADDDGFQGAKRALEYIREKGRSVKAVIGVDMLGDRDLEISIPENVTPTLAKIAHHAARRIGEPDLVRDVNSIVKDDFKIFLDAGMNAVNLIDFDYGPGNSWWHTPEDTCEKLSDESLLKAGRLVVEMLKLLR